MPRQRPNRVVILSGAGLSAPSGIPTFRDAEGLWEGHDIDTVCNTNTFHQNRDKVFAFYNARRQGLASVQPNAAHRMLARLEQKYGNRVVHFTQNVDDLLERAGCKNVTHVHGLLTELKCTKCQGFSWEIGYRNATYGKHEICPNCNNHKGVRPNVVLFGDTAPKYRQMYQAFDDQRSNDIALIIGTSGLVIGVNDLLRDRMTDMARCKALLNVMELPAGHPFDTSLFEKVLLGCCAQSAEAIETFISKRLT